jgi:tripartite-type tricarboxylate transporter receptor subunit TctC
VHLTTFCGIRETWRPPVKEPSWFAWPSSPRCSPWVSPVSGIAVAQDWPTRPVRLLVPYPPGGSTDVAARLLADYLSRSIGQQVFVENRSGAGGVVGMEAAVRSAPDGYTVLVAPDNVSSAAHLFKLTFDPLRDLVPILQISRQPVVLAVHPSLAVASVAEFLAIAKKGPPLSYATSGAGTQQHMVAAWFSKLAGIELEHVPYRGGGQAITGLVAGHVKVGSLGSSPLIPFYKAGTLRLLAQSTAARSPSLPEVPTYQEAGIQGLVLDQWLGAFVPAGTPASIAAERRIEQGPGRPGDPLDALGIGAGADRRQLGSVRAIGPRRLRQIRPARARSEHQGELAVGPAGDLSEAGAACLRGQTGRIVR